MRIRPFLLLLALSGCVVDSEPEAALEPEVASATASVTVPSSVWPDVPGAEFQSWGTRAVGSSLRWHARPPGARIRVYVLDTGASAHPDLNIVQFVNAIAPANAVPGCYAHANHVAGIVGARADGAGSLGVAANVDIVSVSVLDPATQLGPCLAGYGVEAYPGENYVLGMQWIQADIQARGVVGIVNISSNASYFSQAPVRNAIRALATSTKTYPGALVVQSAGNQADDACNFSYGPAAVNDGVLVVGAINDHGHAVRRMNATNGFHNPPTLAQSQPGSNFGACVEAWAPGQEIYSAWSNNGYVTLSGTSMSAPHVAGVAASLAIEGMTSEELEAAVRARFDSLGTVDAANFPMSMPTLAPLPAGTPRNAPYAEIYVGEIGPTEGSPYNNTFETYLGDPLPLISFDVSSRPGQLCDLRRRRNGGAWEQLGQAPPRLIVPGLTWNEGTWEVGSSLCPSGRAQVIVRRPPRGFWTIDGVRQPADHAVTVPRTTPSVLAFESQDTTQCTLEALVFVPDPFWPRYDLLPGYPRTVTTTPVAIGFTRTPGEYRYQAECRDARGRLDHRTLEVTVTEASLTPETGSWWDPTRSGTAMDLRIAAGTMYFTWYTYTPGGTPIWYLGILPETSAGFSGPLYRYSWNGSSATPSAVGDLTVGFSTTTAGTLAWRIGAQQGTQSIERFRFGQGLSVPNLGGSWYDPAQSGWGISFDSQGNTHFAILAVYGASGQATWIYGTSTGNVGSADFSLLRTTGTNLCPSCTGVPSVATFPAGTMTIGLTRLGIGRAFTSIDATLPDGSAWDRWNIDLARLVE